MTPKEEVERQMARDRDEAKMALQFRVEELLKKWGLPPATRSAIAEEIIKEFRS